MKTKKRIPCQYPGGQREGGKALREVHANRGRSRFTSKLGSIPRWDTRENKINRGRLRAHKLLGLQMGRTCTWTGTRYNKESILGLMKGELVEGRRKEFGRKKKTHDSRGTTLSQLNRIKWGNNPD